MKVQCGNMTGNDNNFWDPQKMGRERVQCGNMTGNDNV